MNEIQEKPYKETEWDLDAIWQQQKHEKREKWEEKGKEQGERVYGFGPIARKMFKFLGLAHL